MRIPLLLLIALFPHLSGCIAAECARAAEETPAAEIGVGQEEFQPIEDGEVLTLAYGSQGGTHLWLAVRATGIARGNPLLVDDTTPLVTVRLSSSDGEIPLEGTSARHVFDRDDEGRAVLAGLQFVIDLWAIEAAGLSGQPLRLDVEIEDACGTVVQDEREVLIAEPT